MICVRVSSIRRIPAQLVYLYLGDINVEYLDVLLRLFLVDPRVSILWMTSSP